MKPIAITPRPLETRVPDLGVGLWAAHAPANDMLTAQLDALRPGHVDLLVDLRVDDEIDTLESVLSLFRGRECQLWLYLICDDDAPQAGLARLAEILGTEAEGISGMLLTPAAYLNSYQPDGDWPRTTTPAALVSQARRYWPNLAIGGGFPTYFTELNRCRPDPSTIDFLTHATSPIVHAADDVSVMETLESLPFIFESARAIAPGRRYRITTSAIGAWTNPYGKTITPNATLERVTLSDNDPRQRALFAAAWSVGYLAQAIGRVDSLTLSSIGHPFPIAEPAARYPIFDVLRRLNIGTGRPAMGVAEPLNCLAALGWQTEDERAEFWLANLTDETCVVTVAGTRYAAVLDEQTNPSASALRDWPLERLALCNESPLTLAPYAIARLEITLAHST
ncbi:hypothetical protein [Salinisphaera hydrothermalis]|uniref:Uncharacterized protein n=1 Tax=Salinisphaera hydrothermalis (strain C41B8) TaxID=1304275 RepID=A0A084IJJ7_SALHC|nr:hypothetical protein [Salinisphaera hydrothermalis]KEZ76881.1 hypothetical protein C41B8_12439 [Salinisphaera hydrothermalis C41B8]